MFSDKVLSWKVSHCLYVASSLRHEGKNSGGAWVPVASGGYNPWNPHKIRHTA